MYRLNNRERCIADRSAAILNQSYQHMAYIMTINGTRKEHNGTFNVRKLKEENRVLKVNVIRHIGTLRRHECQCLYNGATRGV